VARGCFDFASCCFLAAFFVEQIGQAIFNHDGTTCTTEVLIWEWRFERNGLDEVDWGSAWQRPADGVGGHRWGYEGD